MTVGRPRVALVSEVLERLLAEPGSARPQRSALFQAALQACAEESRSVKQGHEPRPLAALVERARQILEPPTGPHGPQRPSLATPAPPEIPPPLAEPPHDGCEGPLGGLMATTSFPDLPARPAQDPGAASPGRRRSSSALRLAALGPVILAAVVGYLFLRSRVAIPTAAPPRVSVAVPTTGPPEGGELPTAEPLRPTVIVPTPVPASPGESTTAGSSPTVARPEPETVDAAGGQAVTMVSQDWTGRPPTFVIHFSSYREAENARRDAEDLARRYGRRAYAARVTLPDGTWYRVVLGDFPTAVAARAFRDELAAKDTPGLDGVYLLTAP